MALFLDTIHVYPIKSTRGFSPSSAIVEAKGLQHDRRWMVTDASGEFLTQRKFPKMALIEATPGPDGLALNAPGMDPLLVKVPQNSPPISARIWEGPYPSIPLDNETNAWLSQFLEISVQLVFMPDPTLRPTGVQISGRDIPVSFADSMPFLLISEESLQDLNQRLETPVPMNRFRPNFVTQGGKAFEEDQWHRIRIGSVTFQVVEPCARCMLTTIDQQTATKGKEPLRTLAQYRTFEGEVRFGQKLVAEHEGVVRIHDSVEILEKQ